MSPNISDHYIKREPSSIRKAQILFQSRPDFSIVEVINLAIGNISLPMHPAMLSRLKSIGKPGSPFAEGVVQYTASEGTAECKTAILNSINAELSQNISNDINCVITDGGSQAMELMLLGVSGTSCGKPIMVIDPLYTNYVEFAKRLSIPMVSLERNSNADGSFGDLDIIKIRKKIDEDNPNSILIIPADNPTGLQMSQNLINEIAKICVEKDIWMVSDEAYRNIYFSGTGPSSIWQISNTDVPGIKGRRISIESVSKVWNACGLRIGALVTDNKIMYQKV
ncbi:MAG: aminotransferase class I/II-fold pyridoxal phosphate-dependent enzyme, partial [bacterium]